MAFKQFTLDEDTVVTIYKRRSSRALRLSVTPTGVVRVSIPLWLPYQAGLEFAKSRRGWIAANRSSPSILTTGQAIGKAHHLHFVADALVTKPSSRVRHNEVTITHPLSWPPTDPRLQKLAESASVRALRLQAGRLLPERLQALANKHDLQYRSVTVKRLKSRWGSCDQEGNIVLNLFLMQLPWECIDYVLLHELTHTEVLHHGPTFWQAMQQRLPDVKRLRRQMRGYQPVLNGLMVSRSQSMA